MIAARVDGCWLNDYTIYTGVLRPKYSINDVGVLERGSL